MNGHSSILECFLHWPIYTILSQTKEENNYNEHIFARYMGLGAGQNRFDTFLAPVHQYVLIFNWILPFLEESYNKSGALCIMNNPWILHGNRVIIFFLVFQWTRCLSFWLINWQHADKGFYQEIATPLYCHNNYLCFFQVM